MTMISVVIPAYNEQATIALTLDAFKKQTLKEEFEIILVNNASTDNTVKVARANSQGLKLVIVNEQKKGRGVARATGFTRAQGSIVFSTDADTFVPPDWLEKGLKCFAQSGAIAITGPWYIHDCSTFANFFVNHMQKIMVFPYRITMGHYWLTGLNFAVKKDAYLKAGGFDTTINAHEDEEITWRLRKLGKIVFCDDFWVNTNGRRWKKGVLAGLWSYQKTAFFYYILKNKKKNLEDLR